MGRVKKGVFCLGILVLTSCLSSRVQELAGLYHELGNHYFEQKEYSKAIELYRKSLQLQDNQQQVRYNLALAQIEEKNFSAARITLTSFLRQDPHNIKVKKALAYSYFQEGLYAESERIYNEIYAEIPEDTKLLYNIGTVRNLSKKFKASQQAFDTLRAKLGEETLDKRAYLMMVVNLAQMEKFELVEVYQELMVANQVIDGEDIAELTELYQQQQQPQLAYRLLVLVEDERDLNEDESWLQLNLNFKLQRDLDRGLEQLDAALDAAYQKLDSLRQQRDDQAEGIRKEQGNEQPDKNKIKKLEQQRLEKSEELAEAEGALKMRISSLLANVGRARGLVVAAITAKKEEVAKQREEREAEEAAAKAEQKDEVKTVEDEKKAKESGENAVNKVEAG